MDSVFDDRVLALHEARRADASNRYALAALSQIPRLAWIAPQ